MFTLLNYHEDERRDSASRPKMRETDPIELFEEINEFILDGHSTLITNQLQATQHHITLEQLTEWIQDPIQPLHVATEIYRNEWNPLIFELVLTENL